MICKTSVQDVILTAKFAFTEWRNDLIEFENVFQERVCQQVSLLYFCNIKNKNIYIYI